MSGATTRPPTHRPGGDSAFPRSVYLLALAAIALRLLLLLGRGDYLAFDEGWYLLLARSIFTGDGYTLVGTPHVTLSPLFPILAGALGWLLDSWVWGGRTVAAVAAGLLVFPAWAIFRRLARPRAALLATALVVVMPSLAPFVVAYWIGADLWVGAEPLLHLFLYTGVALWLRADERSERGGGWWDWGLTGAAFALAFLARPEAILTWGLLGLAALTIAAIRRSPRRLAGAAIMGIAFAVVAAPYSLYLHDVTGHWALTGRGISTRSVVSAVAPERTGAASTIERMLWQDDRSYEERLYGLDASGLRLRSEYWGVQPPPPTGPAAATEPGVTPGETGGETRGATTPGGPGPAASSTAPPSTAPPSTAGLYLRALGQILPLLLWPFVILGAFRSRPPGTVRREVPVVVSLLGTSLAIAVLVAVDSRTQLFLVPLLALYAARGFGLVEEVVLERLGGEMRPGFLQSLLAAAAVVWLLGINGQRLYRSLVLGSPHHIVAEQNREVAEELDALLAAPGPVASWHPAIAVWADRDWRVLPFAELPAIVRYEQEAGATGIVLSAYYPPPLAVESLGTRYLVLPVPDPGEREATAPTGPAAPAVGSAPARWSLQIVRGDTIRALGLLVPAN